MNEPESRRAAPRGLARALRAGVLAATAAILAACGGGGGGGSTGPELSIVGQPADTHVVDGTDVVLHVTVHGSASYEWQRLGPSGWADVAGGTTDTLDAGVLHASDSGAQFRVIVASTSTPSDSLTSSVATVTIDANPAAPVVQLAPQSTSVYDGEPATFAVTATGTALAYQWQASRDNGASWDDIAGAKDATLTLNAALSDANEQVRVVVSNGHGRQTSTPASLWVTALPVIPQFVSGPQSTAVAAGAAAVFRVHVVGAGDVAVRWQTALGQDGQWADIPGATGGTYTIAAVSGADDGRQVRVIATNANATAYCGPAKLSFAQSRGAPGIAESPHDAAVAPGFTAHFEAWGYGNPDVTYQWQISVDAGASWTNVNAATGRSLDVGPVALSDDGKRYRVVVSNALGTATSDAAALAVMTLPYVSVASDGVRTAGVTDLGFTAQTMGRQVTFQWRTGSSKDWNGGHDVPGATGIHFLLSKDIPADQDMVCVVATNPVGSQSSCITPFSLAWRAVAPSLATTSMQSAARVDGTTAVMVDGEGVVLRTADSGATWQRVSDGFIGTPRGPFSAAFAGAYGIAIDSPFTVETSSDGGQHWYPGAYTAARSDVAFTDDGRAIAVGDHGAIQLSDDHGQSWHDAAVDANTNGLSAVATHGSLALAVGEGGTIRRSGDRGSTWTTTRMGGYRVSAVAFAADGTALAVDDGGQVLRSADGGLTWAVVGTLPSAAGHMRFTSTGTVLVALSGYSYQNGSWSWGGVMRSVDRGASWTSVPGTAGFGSSLSERVADFVMLDGGTILAAGDGARLMRSTDDGASFASLRPDPSPSLAAVAAADASIGIAVGSGGTVRRTVDGGATGTSVWTPATSNLRAVAFADASLGVVVGEGGTGGTTLRTADGGATWISGVAYGLSGDLVSVAHVSGSTFVACGPAGLWRSVDGGLFWQPVTLSGLPPGATLEAVAFGSGGKGVLLGDDGTVWSSADAGLTWAVTAHASSGAGLNFLSSTVAFVGGYGGGLRSVDGGATWTASTANFPLGQVAFVDANVGYAASSDGSIQKTVDGGASWTIDTSAQYLPLAAITTFPGSAVVAVGLDGLVYRLALD
ncbi:MAG: YCF48-related protein [Burkholderiaceae bacterium]